ncbi:MAG: transcriptional regulator [Paenibacillus sp.]|jgi:DNA-binding MarR family transcriptional regulator|nr:transcriptional regulator [Paenibacillus sp.]
MLKEGLDDSIGFWLGITYRKLSTLFLHRIKHYDLTPEQWSVLYRIGEEDGLIQREIAGRSGKDKPTTTRIMDALEAKGFIVKQPGLTDRRSFKVFITDKGKEVRSLITPVEYKTVQDASAGISGEEYDMLLELLRRISGNVDVLMEKEKGE